MKNTSGIFIFNIIPIYRHGMKDVFDQVNVASVPSASQRIKQNTFFSSLENICGACLPDLDLFYNFATDGDSDYAKINWADPGAFQLIQSGTVTFTINEGFQGNGIDGYLNPSFTPSVHAVSYAQDNASIFHTILDDVSSNNQIDFGCNASGNPSILWNSRDAADRHSGRINVGTAEARGSGVSSQGFFQIQRSQSPIRGRFLKDGVQVGADLAFGTSGIPSKPLLILAYNNNDTIQLFSTRKMGCFGLGASLFGQETALYNAWNTYFSSL